MKDDKTDPGEFAELRRRMVETLNTKELLEGIFSTPHLLIAYMDTDFNFTRVNRAYAEADGRDPEFFIGKNHFDLYPYENNKSIFRRVVETGEPYSVYAKPFEYSEHPERGVTHWDWTLHPVKDASGKVEGLVLCIVDVTQRVKAEEELRRHRDHLEELVEERTAELTKVNERLQREITERKRAEEMLRNALEGSRRRQVQISALLEGSRAVLEYCEFQDAARTIFNSCKKLIGASAGYVALLSEDGTGNEVLFLDSGGLPCTVDLSLPMPIRGLRGEAYRMGKTVYNNEFSESEWVKYMPEGHVSLDNVLFAPLMIEGKTVGLIGLANKPGTFTENDARLASAFGELAAIALRNSQTLELLENSEQRFRSVVQSARDGIIAVDRHGDIVFWSQGAEAIFGYSADEAMGKSFTILLPERFHEEHRKEFNQKVSTVESGIIEPAVESICVRKNSHEFPAEYSLAT